MLIVMALMSGVGLIHLMMAQSSVDVDQAGLDACILFGESFVLNYSNCVNFLVHTEECSRCH